MCALSFFSARETVIPHVAEQEARVRRLLARIAAKARSINRSIVPLLALPSFGLAARVFVRVFDAQSDDKVRSVYVCQNCGAIDCISTTVVACIHCDCAAEQMVQSPLLWLGPLCDFDGAESVLRQLQEPWIGKEMTLSQYHHFQTARFVIRRVIDEKSVHNFPFFTTLKRELTFLRLSRIRPFVQQRILENVCAKVEQSNTSKISKAAFAIDTIHPDSIKTNLSPVFILFFSLNQVLIFYI